MARLPRSIARRLETAEAYFFLPALGDAAGGVFNWAAAKGDGGAAGFGFSAFGFLASRLLLFCPLAIEVLRVASLAPRRSAPAMGPPNAVTRRPSRRILSRQAFA